MNVACGEGVLEKDRVIGVENAGWRGIRALMYILDVAGRWKREERNLDAMI